MLAILTTHPIQYQVPLWQMLARDGRVPFEVWYLTGRGASVRHDHEFGKSFAWDLDMLSGYTYRFLDVVPGATPTTHWKCRLRESLAHRLKVSGTKALWIQGWLVAGYWQAAWQAKRTGVEVWLRAESNDLAPLPPLKRLAKRVILGQFFQRVDRFLYIGTANRRLYQKYGVSEDRLSPAPYAVDNDRFVLQAESIRSQRSEIRRRWSIPDHTFCVLFCGKFIPKKRPFDLVKAAQLLLASHSELRIHLLFAGSGELGGELRAACHVVCDAEASQRSEVRGQRSAPDNRELITDNAKPRASFTGFLNQTEISQAYVAADVLVLPSDYGETWGLVVNEAMASGLICLVSDHCGCAEDLGVITPNEVFHCGDYPALADALARQARNESPMRTKQPPSLAETLETVSRLTSDWRK